MKKKGILLLLCFLLVFTSFLEVQAAPTFEATINFNKEDPVTLNVGEPFILTANWSSNKDVTRYEWYVDGDGQGEEMLGDNDNKQLGNSDFLILFDEEGEYKVEFKIWHHEQIKNGREATAIINIIVVDGQEGNHDCPAAPSVANKILKDNKISNKEIRNYISEVAHEMGSGTDFRGVSKCDKDDYYKAVYEFLIEIGVDLPELED